MSEPYDGAWSSPPQNLSLSDNEIHIWRANLDLPAVLISPFGQTLSTDEWQRAQRFHFERDRRRFIAGRSILRTILSRYLALAPSQIEFCYGPHGKPSLADTCSEQSLCFNLSHSADLALYAVTRDRQIGVDIEQMRRVEAEQLAQRFFSPREYAVINALPPERQQTAFFQLWTCKEAALKATGKGIAGLDQVEASLGVEKPTQLIRLNGDSLSLDSWSIQQLTPAPGYVASLAAEGHDLKVSYLSFLNRYE
ncbi:MAG: 4'-phosphopantetheinyl transferase superfamily protein [Pseudanabaenales cyanobacterium]|nr:4'-phosphopantetheinyl transferase superfamily protein [Pseudanabaenales cyanobacterium]